MPVHSVTMLKCDICGITANCAGFSAEDACSIMRKRGWVTSSHVVICPNCKEEKKIKRKPSSGDRHGMQS